MCGICGTFNYRDGQPADAARVTQMARAIAHRGPDDEGQYVSGPLGLGFRRLSILDLSPAGHQPMADETRRIWVAFNGEIYNFRELRRELEAQGARFRSHGDTEVIVQGYAKWGDALLEKLNGMFGLAIWDESRRKLTLARDPMGIKPVYYALHEGTLFFGSELRAVFAGLGERPPIDPVAANLFLRYRYTPAPHTLYTGVRKLAPGEKLVVQEGVARLSRWYNYHPVPFAQPPRPEEAAEELLAVYRRAMERHLVSDVPVGLLLSGGIDSGLLLGLMNQYGRNWPTFTVGYGTAFRDDELSDADETARLLGSRHAAVRIDQAEFERVLPKVISIVEEPVASSSIVPMYFVAQRARQDVKVALMGQGPDELFGGYKRHLGVRYGSWFRRLPPWSQRALAAGVHRLPRNETLKRATHSMGVDDQLDRFRDIFSLMPGSDVDALFQPDTLARDPNGVIRDCWSPLAPAMAGLDELNAFQLLELRSSLPDELLLYGDKLSMVHGLEVRVPYLDREVVEFVQRLDASLKVRHGTRKWLHRKVCRDFLPREIIARKKRGFAVNVVDDWFRESLGGRIRDFLEDESSLLYRFLRPRPVRDLLRRHASGREDHHKVLFSLVVLEQWLRSNDAAPVEREREPALAVAP